MQSAVLLYVRFFRTFFIRTIYIIQVVVGIGYFNKELNVPPDIRTHRHTRRTIEGNNEIR